MKVGISPNSNFIFQIKINMFSGLDLVSRDSNCLWMLRMRVWRQGSGRSMFTGIGRFRREFNWINQSGGLSIVSEIKVVLEFNLQKELRRCETTKGCEKHYIERTIAGETIYEIERSCKRDDVCYSEYVNCHDVHVSFFIKLGPWVFLQLQDGKDKIGQECVSCCSGNLCNDIRKYYLNPILFISIILLSLLNWSINWKILDLDSFILTKQSSFWHAPIT